MGAVNWLGFWTLYIREVRRFLKVYTQTLMAPVVTTLLFLAVFVLALGGGERLVGGVPFAQFLAPGLVMMAIAQNAFANTSSSIVISKVQGNIVDVLMPPLSALEFTLAYALGGVTRGLLVGLVVGLAMCLFVPLHIVDPGLVVFNGIAASLLLAMLGLIGGIWSEKFDHMAAVTNFIITPLSFLSGTFYSAERLPDGFHFLAHINPFFYMIDGFRAGFIGHADGSLRIGVVLLIVVNAGLVLLCHRMVATGYKLKA